MTTRFGRDRYADVQTVDITHESLAAGRKVLRNTYMLLSATLLFSALCAGLSMAWRLPYFGSLPTLIGYFGLLFLTSKFRNSAWGLLCVFALTGFMGLTLGPILNVFMKMHGGGTIIMGALGMTGLIFFALSAVVLMTKRDFGFLGNFLFIGMLVTIVAVIAGIFLAIPAFHLAISAVIVLLMSGFILYDTSDILHGRETNYIMATVNLYVTLFNLFVNLLQLLGFASDD